MALHGDTALIGSPGDKHGPPDCGTVSVFVRSDTGWEIRALLFATDRQEDDRLGSSVALHGDTALVGAPGVDDGTAGAYQMGAAYVFRRAGGGWTQEAKLVANSGGSNDEFGVSVSLLHDQALIGAPSPWDTTPHQPGSAYVFERSGSSWTETAHLQASDGHDDAEFGRSVSLDHAVVLIGAPRQDGVGWAQGAAYLYVQSAAGWSEWAKLAASDGAADQEFGSGVALCANTALVGRKTYQDGGAVYVYTAPDPGTGYCFGDPQSGTPCPCNNDNDGTIPGSGCANGVFTSGAKLSASGFASVVNDTLVLTTTYAEPLNAGLYFQGNDQVNGGDGSVFGDGLRCAGYGVIRLEVRFADEAGTSSTTIPIATSGGANAGDTGYYQYWYRTVVDPPCGPGVNDFNTTNGFRITWEP